MFVNIGNFSVKKNTYLSFIAKAALSLSHGNAYLERGFTINDLASVVKT
jgi:hypothetical protein